jgi:hypothetical protein
MTSKEEFSSTMLGSIFNSFFLLTREYTFFTSLIRLLRRSIQSCVRCEIFPLTASHRGARYT